MIYEYWVPNQQNLITFIMIDAGGNEVSGLGAGLTMTISKNGGAPVPCAGVQAEMSNGWYSYISTAGEADTIGTISIIVTGVGCRQQNLEYVVEHRNFNCISFTYTVTDVALNPLEDVECCFSIDTAGVHIVWKGYTDIFGVARDSVGNLPCLDAGTYYIRRKKTGYTFVDPDMEVVS